jgi:hypothetical protein
MPDTLSNTCAADGCANLAIGWRSLRGTTSEFAVDYDACDSHGDTIVVHGVERAVGWLMPYDYRPTPENWAALHQSNGHEAMTTTIAAPGTGRGSYCWTCMRHGPRVVRELTVADVI